MVLMPQTGINPVRLLIIFLDDESMTEVIECTQKRTEIIHIKYKNKKEVPNYLRPTQDA